MGGYVTGILVSLGAATILVRHLGIATFGRYVTVTSLVALVAGVTEAGIAVYGIREFAARDESDRRYLMANLLGMRMTLTLVGIVCAVGFGLIAGYPQIMVIGTVVAGVGLLVQVVGEVMSISLQAQLLLGSLTIVELCRRVATLILIGALALLDATLLPFLAASTVAGAVAVALLMWMVRSSFTIKLRVDWQMWRDLFSETLPFALAVSIGAVYFYVTVILMSLIATAHQTGIFGTSFRVTQVALAIPSILLTAIFPLMSQEHSAQDSALGAMLGKVFTVAVIGGIWMSLALALGAGFIINIIAGSQGQEAVSVLRIQGLVFTVSFISTACVFGFLSLRQYRPMMITSSSALLLNIVLSLIFIPVLGARGGAFADVITETVEAIGLTIILTRAVPRYRIPVSALPVAALAAALASSVLLVPVGSIARVVGASVIYFGILLFTDAIPSDVLDVAQRLPVMRILFRDSAK